MLDMIASRVAAKIMAKMSEASDKFADIVTAAVTKRLSTTLELISEEVLKLRQIENELADIKQFIVDNGGYLETILAKAEDAASGANEIKAELERIDFTQELKETISKVDHLSSVVKQKKKNGKKKGK